MEERTYAVKINGAKPDAEYLILTMTPGTITATSDAISEAEMREELSKRGMAKSEIETGGQWPSNESRCRPGMLSRWLD